MHIEKRWRRESLKSDYPIVRVKQVWDPRQRSYDEQRQGKIENGWSGVREKLGGEVKAEEHQEEMVMGVEEVIDRSGEYIREEEEILQGEESEAENNDEEEYEQQSPLKKRHVVKDSSFKESLKLLKKIFAEIYS